MRIISNFHDYYDSAMSMGQSPVIYQRKEEEANIKKWPFPLDNYKLNNWINYNGCPNYKRLVINKPCIIGFCGKIYPLQILRLSQTTKVSKDPHPEVFCYSLEDVDKFIHGEFEKLPRSKNRLKAYEVPDRRKWWRYNRSWNAAPRRDYKLFFDTIDDHQDAYGEMFLQKRSPIFFARKRNPKRGFDGEFIWNCELKKYEFFRIKDVYTAYQEIEMFMNNLASPEKPIPHISDEDLASVKGFDKWSFRKEPKKEKK